MRKVLILSGFIFTICGIYGLLKTGFSWEILKGVIFFGAGTLFFIFEDKLINWSLDLQKRKIKATFCIPKEDHIYFPKGYYYNYGYLKNKNKLPYSIIDEIRINTHPITAKINSSEIIFLKGLDKENCVEINRKSNIPLTEPQDNWSLICDDFLDTEFDESYKERTTSLLEKTGINGEELKKIRKRISFRMMLRTYVTWEWGYYGQYDVLTELWPLNSKKYWWTMDITLRKKNEL